MSEVSATAARRVRSHCHSGDGAVEVEVDKISGLPDEILQHILTFTPTKYAIRTSLLSKRWRHVWCDHTPSLSFNTSNLNAARINQALTRYTASKITQFLLDINGNNSVRRIDRWIKFAMSLHVENLCLSLLVKRYCLPDFFYVNSSLKQLTLKYLETFPKCSVSWTSLKNLCLFRCIVSDESMAKILSGCPVLESLTLHHCYKLGYLDLSRSPRVKTLVVEPNSSARGPEDIEAPHIHYLYLSFSEPCTLVDVSSLTEANVNLCTNELSTYSNGFCDDKVINMLEKLQHVEKLTFGGSLLQVLSFAELRGVPFPMFKVKSLTLKTRMFDNVIPVIKRMLQNSHDLNKLTVHTFHWKTKQASRLERYFSRLRSGSVVAEIKRCGPLGY